MQRRGLFGSTSGPEGPQVVRSAAAQNCSANCVRGDDVHYVDRSNYSDDALTLSVTIGSDNCRSIPDFCVSHFGNNG